MDKRIIYLNVQDVEKRRHPSKHYVYVINVTWQDDSTTIVYRRYNRFFEFQNKLLEKFPEEAGLINPADRIIPFLPGKIFFGRSSILNVALKRLPHIDRYCKDLLKLPSHIPQCDDMLRFFECTSEDLLPESKQEEEICARVISQPVLPDKYRVAISYETEKLNLGAGSLVDVLEKSDSGWWFVRTDVNQGWMPARYLESLTGGAISQSIHTEPTESCKYVCTRSYKPQQADEVAINKGALVQVLEKNLDGWWLVRCNGQTGRAPGTYMTRTGTLKANRLKDVLGGLSAALLPKLVTPSGDNQEPKTASSNQYSAIADFTSHTTDGIHLRQDDIVQVLSKDASGWWMVRCGNRQGWAPSTYLQAIGSVTTTLSQTTHDDGRNCADEDEDYDDFDDDDFDDEFDDEYEDDVVDGSSNPIHRDPPVESASHAVSVPPIATRYRPTPPPKPCKPAVPPKPPAKPSPKPSDQNHRTETSATKNTTNQTTRLFQELQRKFEN